MELTWNADPETFRFKNIVHYGSRREFACQSSWGIREYGYFGKLYPYKFSTYIIKKTVFDIIINARWNLKLSMPSRYGIKFLWGFIILLMLSGLAIYLF